MTEEDEKCAFVRDAFEDSWNDPGFGQDLRRHYAKERCSHIKVGDGDWLDCEADGDEILRRMGPWRCDANIRGRFQVEDFHDEEKFTEEEGHVTFNDARSSVIAGRLRAKAREEEATVIVSEAEFFGVCSICKTNCGYLNIGREHWFYCEKHRIRWLRGENLFSSWRHETPDDWKLYREYLEPFRIVEPSMGTEDDY